MALQIFFIPLSGENPESKANASANLEVVVSLKGTKVPGSGRRSEEGYAMAVRRLTEPESVLGQLNNNRGFRGFLLRGMHKVTLEVGWLSLAHNLRS